MKSTSSVASTGGGGSVDDGCQHHVAVAVAASKLGLDEQLRAAVEACSAVLQATDNDGRTCLHYAAACGHDECVEILLEAGANPLAADAKGDVPLHFASVNKHPMCAYIITKASPDSCLLQNRKLQTPVQAAVACNSYEVLNAMLLACSGDAGKVAVAVMRVLLAAGAVPDTWAPNGSSALMLAASADATEALQVLLDNGATVELQDSLGRSALMFAAGNNSAGALQQLLAAGACLAQRDRRGRSVLEYAPENSQVRAVLQERLDSLEEAATKLQDDLLASLEQEAASGKKKGPKKSSKKKKGKAAQQAPAAIAAAAAAEGMEAAQEAALADAAAAPEEAAASAVQQPQAAAAEAEEAPGAAATLDVADADGLSAVAASEDEAAAVLQQDAEVVAAPVPAAGESAPGALAVAGEEADAVGAGSCEAAAAASSVCSPADKQALEEAEEEGAMGEVSTWGCDGEEAAGVDLLAVPEAALLHNDAELLEEAAAKTAGMEQTAQAREDGWQVVATKAPKRATPGHKATEHHISPRVLEVPISRVPPLMPSQQPSPASKAYLPPHKKMAVKTAAPAQPKATAAAPSTAQQAAAPSHYDSLFNDASASAAASSFKSALLGRASAAAAAATLDPSGLASPPTTPTPTPYHRDQSTDGSTPETPNSSTCPPYYPPHPHHHPHPHHLDHWSSFDSPSFLSAAFPSQSSLATSSHDDPPSAPPSTTAPTPTPDDAPCHPPPIATAAAHHISAPASEHSAAHELRLLAVKVAHLEARHKSLQSMLHATKRRHAQELAMVLEDAAQHEADAVSRAAAAERARIFGSLQALGLSQEVLLLLLPPTSAQAPSAPHPSSLPLPLTPLPTHQHLPAFPASHPLASPLPTLTPPVHRAPSFASTPPTSAISLPAFAAPKPGHSPQSLSPLGTPPLTCEMLHLYAKMSTTNDAQSIASHCLTPRRAVSPCPSDWDLQACLPVDLFDAPTTCVN